MPKNFQDFNIIEFDYLNFENNNASYENNWFNSQEENEQYASQTNIADNMLEELNPFYSTENHKKTNNLQLQVQQEQQKQDEDLIFYDVDGKPLLETQRDYVAENKTKLEYLEANYIGNTQLPSETQTPCMSRNESVSTNYVKEEKPKAKKSQYQKNIGRYLIQQMITTMLDGTYKAKLLEMLQNDTLALKDFQKFIGKFRYKEENFLSGPRIIQQFLLSKKDDESAFFTKIFREFSIWFLQFKALTHIINGHMQSKEEYIKYKNHILLKLMKNPKQWKSNKETKQPRTVVNKNK